MGDIFEVPLGGARYSEGKSSKTVKNYVLNSNPIPNDFIANNLLTSQGSPLGLWTKSVDNTYGETATVSPYGAETSISIATSKPIQGSILQWGGVNFKLKNLKKGKYRYAFEARSLTGSPFWVSTWQYSVLNNHVLNFRDWQLSTVWQTFVFDGDPEFIQENFSPLVADFSEVFSVGYTGLRGSKGFDQLLNASNFPTNLSVNFSIRNIQVIEVSQSPDIDLTSMPVACGAVGSDCATTASGYNITGSGLMLESGAKNYLRQNKSIYYREYDGSGNPVYNSGFSGQLYWSGVSPQNLVISNNLWYIGAVSTYNNYVDVQAPFGWSPVGFAFDGNNGNAVKFSQFIQMPTTASSRVLSMYVKADQAFKFSMNLDDGAVLPATHAYSLACQFQSTAIFGTSNYEISAIAPGTGASVIALKNSWFRVSCAGLSASTLPATQTFSIMLYPRVNSTPAPVFMAGFQAEVGSVPSTLILSYDQPSTRGAETIEVLSSFPQNLLKYPVLTEELVNQLLTVNFRSTSQISSNAQSEYILSNQNYSAAGSSYNFKTSIAPSSTKALSILKVLNFTF